MGSAQPLDEVELPQGPAAFHRPGVAAGRHPHDQSLGRRLDRELPPELTLPRGDVVEPYLQRPLAAPERVEMPRIVAPLLDPVVGPAQSRKDTVGSRSVE